MLEMNLMYRLDINVNHFIRKKLYAYIISDISIILIYNINDALGDYLKKG